MAKRVTRWLSVNGVVDSFRNHLIEAGYRAGFETTIGKRLKTRPNLLPLEEIKKYLGENVKEASEPFGSHKNNGKPNVTSNRGFLFMKLSSNPKKDCYYY